MATRTGARRTTRALLAPAILAMAITAGCSSANPTPSSTPSSAQSSDTTSSGSSAAEGGSVTIMAAGDIAQSGSKLANAAATGDLIRRVNPDAVLALGDQAYEDGHPGDYATKYRPTWGSFKGKTHPVPGNHDYHSDPPVGYLGYFGKERVTNPVDGGVYYAWNVGNGWRAYAMNTEVDTSGDQLAWLKQDLSAHPAKHYILYGHKPRYSSGDQHGPSDTICPLWDALEATGKLEIVLAGHEHIYERFARMDCGGHKSPRGPRSFVVGSGGNQLYGLSTPLPGSQFRNNTDFGVLKLVLGRSSYRWSFIASGRGFDGSTSIDTNRAGRVIDSGTQSTHAP